MTYYVFVIDNSASMVQVSHTGTMVLDHAKNFVDYFYKQRVKDRGPDKFDVVTCDEYPYCVIRHRDANSFLEEIKQIRPTGSQSVESAVGRAFWILAVNRKGADNIALGRRLIADPGVVILLTDGGLGDQPFVPDRIHCAINSFYTDVWKGDQRFFSVTLRFPSRLSGAPHSTQIPESDPGRFLQFSQATGGFSYVVSNPRQLMVTADNILSKTNAIGMRINYVYIGPELDPRHSDKSAPWKSGTVVVHAVGRENGSLEWGLPEAFWPENVVEAVPLRSAMPQIQLTYSPNPPPAFRDSRCRSRFDIEHCELTRFMIDREVSTKCGGCYPICVPGSSKGPGLPVGYFRVEQIGKNGECAPKLVVMLYVSTYNYLKFADLYEQALSQKSNSTKNALIEYLKGVPPYYLYNKSALVLLIQNEFPFVQQMIVSKPYNKIVMDTLVKFLQNTKSEATEFNQATLEIKDRYFIPQYDEIIVKEALLSKEYPGTPFKREEYMTELPEKVYLDLYPSKDLNPSRLFFHSVFIARTALFEYITKMRVNYNLFDRDHDLHVLEGGMVGKKINLADAEDLHSRPVKEMGEYRMYDRQKEACGYVKMREVMPTAGRAETFGNPFKQDKKGSVDEIGEEEGNMQRLNSPAPIQKSLKDESRKISLSSFSKLRYRTYRNSGVSSVMTSRQTSPVPDEDIFSKYQNGPDTPNGYSETNGNGRESSPTPSLINGIAGMTVKRTVSFSDVEDDSQDESPAIKKRRESIGASGGLNYVQISQKKTEATVLVKSLIRTSSDLILNKISGLTDGLNKNDKKAIYQKALEVARGMSGAKLITLLEKEITKLQVQ